MTNAVALAKKSDVAVVVSRLLLIVVSFGAGVARTLSASEVEVVVIVIDEFNSTFGFGWNDSLSVLKLPHAMRVVLAKCSTKERLPKKAPRSSRKETKESVKEAL